MTRRFRTASFVNGVLALALALMSLLSLWVWAMARGGKGGAWTWLVVALAFAAGAYGAGLRRGYWRRMAERTEDSTEPVGPANGSQPIRSETNSTSSAAGSRR